MNDFGTPPPELINLGTLTVGGAFDMTADSILHNFRNRQRRRALEIGGASMQAFCSIIRAP